MIDEYRRGVDIKDDSYSNREERIIITEKEQIIARKHGEISNGQVTRYDHYGKKVSGEWSRYTIEEIVKIIANYNELLQ